MELAALDQLKKPLNLLLENYSKYLMTCCQVNDGCPLGYLLIGSSSFLQVMRTTIKAWMSPNLGRIPPLTSELAALERLKKRHIMLLAL